MPTSHWFQVIKQGSQQLGSQFADPRRARNKMVLGKGLVRTSGKQPQLEEEALTSRLSLSSPDAAGMRTREACQHLISSNGCSF